MSLTLTRRESSPVPLEVFGLTPEKLRGLSIADVAKLKVRHGNRAQEVGEHFDVRGELGENLFLEFRGDCSRANGIGAGMAKGSIGVDGAVGGHAGAKMSGGSLTVLFAGDWLGAEMSGGKILVGITAGNHVGGAYPGSRRGMRGGHIVIKGDAGDEVGQHMRRGHIIVRGKVGEFCGASMIAGTIVAGDGIGPRCGAGMKRGTIVTVGPEPEWAPGFGYACEYRPAYAEVVRRELKGVIDRPIETIRLYRGDLTAGGRGEIWQVTAGDR